MTKISREEVLHIAKMSHLDIHDDEIDPLIKQLESVLSYAARLQEITLDTVEMPSTKTVNVFRADEVIRTAVEPILALAPEREENFFVVPTILDNK